MIRDVAIAKAHNQLKNILKLNIYLFITTFITCITKQHYNDPRI